VADALGNSDSTYKDRQAQHDREYAAAWENAPPEFKIKASAFGLKPETLQTEGMAMEFNDNYSTQVHIPNMADALDDIVDEIIEILGPDKAPVVRATYRLLRKAMEDEMMRTRSNDILRVAMLLCFDEKGNLRARVHALLHTVPRLPSQNGFPSMRSSAKICGVSPEWLRRKRDGWCDVLEMAPPAHGIKSDPAKLKYRINALKNHWRNQTYQANTNYDRTYRQRSAQQQQQRARLAN
jgi:hypothetical protein